MSCDPIITPADCNSAATATPTAPTPQPGDLFPQIHPVMPPIDGHQHHDGGFLQPLVAHEHLPHWDWNTVLHTVMVGGACTVAGLVVVVGLLGIATMLAWQPARVRNWALGALLAMPGASMAFAWDWHAPLHEFHAGATDLLAGHLVAGIAGMGVLILPAAWLTVMLAYTNRVVQLATRGLPSPAATERAIWARAARQQRAAARLSRYRVPFSTGGLNPDVVFGRLGAEESAAPPASRWRALAARTESRLIVPWIKMCEHMITVASSGKGKTTLTHRALLSWFITAWQRHRQWWRLARTGRPLSMVIDCNGGPESVRSAQKLARWYKALGVPAERIGIFPYDVQLDLWSMSPDDMRSILAAMVSGGAVPTDATEKYFHEIRENLIHLVVDAPARVDPKTKEPSGQNPPRSWIEFLSRFDPKKLAQLWGGVLSKNTPWAGVPGVDQKIGACLDGEQPVIRSALAEFSNLHRALGPAFDGDAQITDFDLLYIVLDGVTQPDRARAQFGALGCLLEQLADRDHGRQTLLVVDEFSAVSDGKTRADKWVMRLRKAGVSTWWFAQDWNGLGWNDEQRESLVAAGSGGAVLGGQEGAGAEKLAKTFGTTRRFELSRKLINGTSHGDEGNVQPHDGWLIDPNRLRRLDKGDIVHVSGGRARWGRVAPLDEATFKALRPLPGLGRSVTDTPTDVAPVIDLNQRRRAS